MKNNWKSSGRNLMKMLDHKLKEAKGSIEEQLKEQQQKFDAELDQILREITETVTETLDYSETF